MDGAAAPLISVIVPVFNVADHIAEAIASLRAQTLADFEALVIDDGSTDGSGARAQAAFQGDSRFRLIRQQNRGLSGARNVGLDQARGAFVAFLDGDDACDPAFLQTLHRALTEDGTDWAACGVSLCYPDGGRIAHAAMHGGGAQAAGVLAMTDAVDVARQFPSAWNKLYRRAFLGDLRFPEGRWFEDHEVYWALAARHRPLSYRPAPLYLHRRDRPGQITGSDSDRVFEQFAVIEQVQHLILGGGFTRAGQGLANLVTRLLHERAAVLRQRDRRARFLAQARALMARLGLAYAPVWDDEISRGLGLALAGEVPVSVVVQAGAGLEATLAALDAQDMADFDLTVIGRGAEGAPETLPSGLPVQRLPEATLDAVVPGLAGRHVVVFSPGEAPAEGGLMRLCNLIERTGAPMAFGGFLRAQRGYHDGWTDNTQAGCDLQRLALAGEALALGQAQALRLFPMLGNRIVRRTLLAGAGGGAADPLQVQALVLRLAEASGVAGYTRVAVARAPDLPGPVPAPCVLARWAAGLSAPSLPRHWQAVVFWRMVRFRAEAAPGRLGRTRVWLGAWPCAWRSGLARRAPGAAPDPETPGWLVRALRR